MKKALKTILLASLVFAIANINAQSLAWAKGMAGPADDIGYSIAVDGSGNVYTTGSFHGTVDFDPGIGIANLTAAGLNDIYLSKLSSSGNLLWAINLGASSSDIGYSLTLDASGNVYTTGYFTGTVDFDPGVGTANLTAIGGADMFVSKLDASGNFIWAKNMGGSMNEIAYSIKVDAMGNVYTMGVFNGIADFDPGVGTANLISGNADIFISKLDVSGNFLWAKKLGGISNDFGYSMALDAVGNVYTTGHFNGVADFDPGIGIVNLTSAAFNDVFISKLDASGNFLWAKNLGGVESENGYSIDVDALGNVYTTGYFRGTVDFDPGLGVVNLTAEGIFDAYISKLDPLGNYVWAKSMGGNGFDIGRSIAVDLSGNVYTTGYFSDTVDFDPGVGVDTLISAGDNDIYLSKLDVAGNYVWAKRIGGAARDQAHSITLDGFGSLYVTGNFTDTVDFDPGIGVANLFGVGGDDVFIQKFNLCTVHTSSSFSVVKCGSYTVPSGDETYTTGGTQTVMDTIPNNCGADSVMTIAVTILPGLTGSVTNTICSNGSIVINGTIYNATNPNGTEVFTNIGPNNCDSIVTISLTVNNIDTSTTVTGEGISSNQLGATYQWIDCSNGNAAIPGADSVDYEVTINGSYAVVVTLNGCNDTSSCVNINTVGVNMPAAENKFSIYPNPTKDEVIIDFGVVKTAVISVVNITGQEVYNSGKVNGAQVEISLREFNKGIYFIKIATESNVRTQRLIKQ